MAKDLLTELSLPADVVKDFQESYTEVKLFPRLFAGMSILVCDRCGAYVSANEGVGKLHKLWHRNTSLVVWLLQRYVVEHSKSHVTFGITMNAFIESIECEESNG